MKFYYIFFLSLIACNNQIALSSEESDICQIVNSDESNARQDIHEEIHRIALKQGQAIDLYLEDLAQAVKTNRIKLKNQDKFQEYIIQIINIIKKIKNENALEDDKNNTLKLLKFNSIILDNIEIAISLKLQAFDELVQLEILKEISSCDKFDLAQACKLLQHNQKKLEKLKISLAHFNFTNVNLLAQNAEKLLKHLHLLKIGKRLAPYACIGLCLVLKNMLINKLKLEKPTQEHKNGHALMQNLINIDHKPVVEIGLGLLFGSTIKQDATDFKDWGIKQAKKISAYIKGERAPSETIRRPKLNFEDIIGYDFVKEEFKKVANYFQEKKLLDFVDSYVDHNYLLVGPCDIGANLADALANQITKVISQENKNAFCGVYELHASKLLDKKLADIIKEAENHDYPCIIILKELHWLAKHAYKKAEIWSNLLDGLNCLKNPLKEVFIVATTSTFEDYISELSPASKVIRLEKPNFKERKDFFQKKLLERYANMENFDLETLAKLTENCSFNALSNIMRLACNIAHAKTESLKQSHIEESIDELKIN